MAGRKKETSEKKPSVSFDALKALGLQDLKIGDKVIGQVVPREFSTGSYGLGFNGKVLLQLPGGEVAKMQATINITVIDSKHAPEVVVPASDKVAAAG